METETPYRGDPCASLRAQLADSESTSDQHCERANTAERKLARSRAGWALVAFITSLLTTLATLVVFTWAHDGSAREPTRADRVHHAHLVATTYFASLYPAATIHISCGAVVDDSSAYCLASVGALHFSARCDTHAAADNGGCDTLQVVQLPVIP